MDEYHKNAKIRLLTKIKINNKTECWEWTAHVSPKGYGQICYKGNAIAAHRLSYLLFVGPLTLGLELDHLCRNRSCVNPKHLEQVTHHENILRGNAGLHEKIKTHCPQGHEYSKKNTRIQRGGRLCIECRRVQSINNYYKNTLLTVK